MNKAAKTISDAIIGADFKTYILNGKAYTIYPPTIKRLAGCISALGDFPEGDSVKGILSAMKDQTALSRALSYLVKGDYSLEDELGNVPYAEVVGALSEVLTLTSTVPFQAAAILARNVAKMAATPKQ